MSPAATPAQERGARSLNFLFAFATLTALFAALLSVRRRGDPSGLETLMGVLNLPMAPTAASVVLLALTTRALVGRKRLGWWLVAAFQLVGIGFGILAVLDRAVTDVPSPWRAHDQLSGRVDVVAGVVAVVALWWLWQIRPAYPGRLQPGSFRLGLLALLAGLAVTALALWALLVLQHGRSVTVGLYAATISVAIGDSDHARMVAGSVWPITIGVTGALITLSQLLAALAALSGARHRAVMTPDEELAVRRLLADTGGEDSLGYFATRRDKTVIFAPDGKACVTYQVRAGVALASGDPVGHPASWPAAIAAWKAESRRYGWSAAAISASELGATAYAATGLGVLPMGDEAVLYPDRLDLAQPSMTALRHTVRHAEREGVTVSIHRQSALSPDQLARLAGAAEQWRGDEPERGFSMALGRDQDPADDRRLHVLARDAAGQLVGLLGFVPWGRDGVSLDVMRRSPGAPNGTTELMVTSLLQDAAELGLRRVSLNFVLFRGVYASASRVGAGTLTRLNYSVLGFLDRFWQLERLYRSNAKYDPEWVPRYLAYEGGASLPQVVIAAASLEGFLPDFAVGGLARQRPLDDAHLAQLRALDAVPGPDPQVDLPNPSDQTRHRLSQVARMRTAGIDPYPPSPGSFVTDLGGALEQPGEQALAGRVRRLRDHGGVVFLVLRDAAGFQLQVVAERSHLGDAGLRELRALVGTGDLVGVTGTVGRSRTGTPSLLVREWVMLAKALHPIPFGGLTDPEARVRQRSTDLIVHPDAVRVLRLRAQVVRSLRESMARAGALEVQTPMLHTIHGGATARPFRTWINAYGVELSLRIAPELYLKRLVVGGLGTLYELGRNFRNEGADATHNPEFTSMEVYQPFGDYTTMRELAQELIRAAAASLHGRPLMPIPVSPGSRDTLATDLSEPWPVIPVLDAVSAATGEQVSLDTTVEELLTIAAAHGITVPGGLGVGGLIEELYAELVEPVTMTPTFFVDFPAETSPLARPHRSAPGLAERWDLVVSGTELATAYTELTDPLEQRRRLTEQSWHAAHGDPEAMEVDADFLRALELGMPPTGGLGLGVDRLVMLLLNTSIRPVLSFPFVRPDS